MSTVWIDVPEEVPISLKTSREAFSRELPLLAAVKLFELERLSSGRAARLAGVSRIEFLDCLGRYGVSPLDLSEEDLRRDLADA